MNTKLVSSIEVTTRSRLATTLVDSPLVDVAKLLTNTQISLGVVCDSNGAMTGIVMKTNIVRQIGDCLGAVCRVAAPDAMRTDVVHCHSRDFLPDVLALMQKRRFVHIGRRRAVRVARRRQCARCVAFTDGRRRIRRSALLRDYVMDVGYQRSTLPSSTRGRSAHADLPPPDLPTIKSIAALPAKWSFSKLVEEVSPLASAASTGPSFHLLIGVTG